MAATTIAPAAGTKKRKSKKAPLDKVKGAKWWAVLGWRHLIGIAAVVYAIIPILYIISASLNPLGSLSSTGIFPSEFSTTNFASLFNNPTRPFARWYANSLIVAGIVVFVQLLFSTFAAYAFSRFRFRGRRAGLLSLLLVLMFPQILVTVALFQMFSVVGDVIPALGLDSLIGYIAIMLGGSLGQVYLITGFFDTIPHELDKAAKIDGAGHARLVFTIILPLVRPILVVTGLISFVGVIAEFLLASIFLRTAGVKSLAVGMYGVLMGDKSNNLGWFAAASVLVAIPAILLFQWLQKYIVGGITAGAVKG